MGLPVFLRYDTGFTNHITSNKAYNPIHVKFEFSF